MSDIVEKNITISIPFSTTESAALAYEVLSVDKELKGSGVRRELTTNETNLIINFHGTDMKRLRVASNAILKNVLLIVKTMSQFEPR